MTHPSRGADGNAFYGWLDVGENKPTYEPPRNAPCPFCGFPIHAADVRTHSLMYTGDVRSYFYRTHRTCDEKDPTHTAMDGFILDMIGRNHD